MNSHEEYIKEKNRRDFLGIAIFIIVGLLIAGFFSQYDDKRMNRSYKEGYEEGYNDGYSEALSKYGIDE